MGHAGHVASAVKAGHGGGAGFIGPDAGSGVAGAKAHFGDVHFHHALAVVHVSAFVEAAAGGAFVGVQNSLNFLDGFFSQVVQFQEHRAGAGFQLLEELQHHLAGPVIALDKALAKGVGGEAPQWAGHIGTSRAVVVLEQRVYLETFQVCQVRAGVIGHGVSITVVGRVFIGAEQVTGRWQAQAASGTGSHDHGFGANDDGFRRACVHSDHAGDLAVRVFQQTRSRVAVLDLYPVTAQATIEDLLDVVTLRHRQYIST